jgi:hypothetical protein
VLAALAIASTASVVMSVSRTSTVAVTQPRLRHFGGLVLALEALAPALDGGDELREVDLERVEDLVGVVLAPRRISRSRARASSMMSSAARSACLRPPARRSAASGARAPLIRLPALGLGQHLLAL